MGGMKTCTKCKERKDKQEFSKNRQLECKLAYWCKMCVNTNNKRWYVKNIERERSIRRQYRLDHVEQARAYTKRYAEENPEKIKSANKKWYEANRENRKAYGKEYHAANQEKRKANSKEYYAMHLEEYLEYATTRRARKKNAYVAPVDRLKIFERDGGRCHICKKKVSPKKWHLDHIIPLARNGTHEPKNVAVSHPKCNLKKHASGTAQLRLIN